jgi:hypothetical protein
MAGAEEGREVLLGYVHMPVGEINENAGFSHDSS